MNEFKCIDWINLHLLRLSMSFLDKDKIENFFSQSLSEFIVFLGKANNLHEIQFTFSLCLNFPFPTK